MTPRSHEDRIEDAARAIDPVSFDYLKGHEQGNCPDCDANRQRARDDAIAAIRAYLGDDVVVPREPTNKMILAALDDCDKRGGRSRDQSYGDMYRAMLAATPFPSEEV